MANGTKSNVPWLALLGFGGAVVGTLGTLLVQRLLPPPAAGDGFSVRWLDAAGTEKRVDFGDNEKAALERAVALASQYRVSVEIVEIRQGRVVNIQRAGQATREVA